MRAISLATVFVAIAGYLVIWVANKGLSTAGYEDFMVYWSLFFAMTGVLDGLMQETTRAVSTRRAQPTAPRTATRKATRTAKRNPTEQTPRPFALTGYIAVAVGVLALATGPLWIGELVPSQTGWGLLLLAVGLACYTFQATVCGLLSANHSWPSFAWLMAIDSGVRLALAVVAWALGWQLLAYLFVTVIGAATWLLILACSRSARATLRDRADVAARPFLSRTLKAMVASGANAVMITGFSVLLRYTSGEEVGPGALAATITAITLTRAPILVPLQRFQPALIVHFTKHRERVLRAAALPITAVGAVAAIGGVAAFFLAAPLMGLFFDAAVISSPSTLRWLTLVSGATAILMISGSAALAADRHNLYTAGWLIAIALSTAVLMLDFSPDTRAILALAIGPSVGAAVQLGVLALAAAEGKPKASSPAPAGLE
ncbi:hypothetical protein [Corynebacterium sp. LK28]|uniref:hypothetical protein n=1 Tax=Corynebacterium sp. LK28 TaxID=2044579 RepID=UPI0016526760|nr:hypothetical protein [Corynebacterium sp. LK28]MBC6794968.1 hypothetical protein [Corynebacterium sp. LK28]